MCDRVKKERADESKEKTEVQSIVLLHRGKALRMSSG